MHCNRRIGALLAHAFGPPLGRGGTQPSAKKANNLAGAVLGRLPSKQTTSAGCEGVRRGVRSSVAKARAPRPLFLPP
jgi:hypothetical protein